MHHAFPRDLLCVLVARKKIW